MSLVFSPSTTRALLSAVAPFAPLPASYLTMPVVSPRPRARSCPAPPVVVRPPPEWEDIELRPMGATSGSRAARTYPEAGGAFDDDAAPIMLGVAAASGFSARPLAGPVPCPRMRTRSTMSRVAEFARDAPPALGDQGARLCGAVKTAKTTLCSRTRRALNNVLPAFGAPSRARAGYVRLQGRTH
ncbi:hypothetical protein DAEQUDRAFT_387672 [Daedalea quercina L-15889]|uniref:Uncharacterized protein n=1 Tax=Daedalea quercina L-15889 TaxID=1314783 RepID=A0A165NY21_9APHY|nr:hypothetical protein DAEQUDRAFT_387672 [Daedalea quercina L-15889]